MKQTQAPSTNLSPREPSKVPEIQMKAKKMQFGIDFAARTAQVEGPTIPAIGGGSNNAESGHTDAYSVEASGVEALKAMEGRLMNAISDGMKEVNKKVKSLSNRLTLVENEVKSLRVSVPGMSELPSEGESDNPSDQDGSDNPSEEDGGDTPSEEDKDGGFKDDSVLAIANQVQSEHGNGDDDMDDTAEMSAAAEQLESEMLEKANTEKKIKKRMRKDDGK
ncbi:BnaC02g26250D [Brassica napus]|uniref:BnaC02g26250D protein n=1 Tax=Brassica napus TaxID=3708 RepID=A0A078H6Q6_BRANA|nr:BnaC02g26250D [Brassica napus]